MRLALGSTKINKETQNTKGKKLTSFKEDQVWEELEENAEENKWKRGIKTQKAQGKTNRY